MDNRVEKVARALPPNARRAVETILFQRPWEEDALLRLLSSTDLGDAFWLKMESVMLKDTDRGIPAFFAIKCILAEALSFSVDAPDEAQDRLEKHEKRRKAASLLRAALELLSDDEVAARVSVQGFFDNARPAMSSAQRQAELLHQAHKDLPGYLMAYGPTMLETIAELSTTLDAGESLDYFDSRPSTIPVPKKGGTRARLFFERRIVRTFRDLTGAPQYHLAALLVSAATGDDVSEWDIKSRDRRARKR